MAKSLFILNDAPYGSERSYNALRLAAAIAKREREEVKVFLFGDAASCAKAQQHVPQGFHNVEVMLRDLAKQGAPIGACASCMDARGITDAELAPGVHRGSLDEVASWTFWAENVLVF